ncbi:MAG: SapC family protein [Gammaproteobacteria bacterium]
MTTQLMFYERVTPVSTERHGAWGIEPLESFAFAATANSVPLTAVEFPLAVRDFPIVFAGNEEAVMPIVLLGTEAGHNEFVTAAGAWDADYIPAFVRRYPFVFSQSEDGETFNLCVDEKYPGCNDDGGGERLFDDEGQRTPFLDKIVDFLSEYQGHFARTQEYCRKLMELDLLEPMKAEFTLDGDEEKHAVTGFSAVGRERLKALPGDTLAQMMSSDELELSFLHLASMQNIGRLVARTAARRNARQDG